MQNTLKQVNYLMKPYRIEKYLKLLTTNSAFAIQTAHVRNNGLDVVNVSRLWSKPRSTLINAIF